MSTERAEREHPTALRVDKHRPVWSEYERIDAHTREITMTSALEALVAKAQRIQMTEVQEREQRLSFVYGNTHIENDRITREMVAAADEKIQREEAASRR